MYTRVVKARNKDGSTRSYLQLVHAYRKNGKVRQKLICSIGRLDMVTANGALDRLITSLARHSERCWVEAEAGPGRALADVRARARLPPVVGTPGPGSRGWRTTSAPV